MSERVSDQVRAGRARNAKLEAMARLVPATECDQHEMLKAVVYDLHAAMGLEDWECVAEVTAVIEDVIGFKLSES